MRAQSLAAFCLLAAIWGTTWLAIKLVVREAPPLTAAGARFTLAAVLLAAFSLWRGRSLRWKRFAAAERRLLLVLALLMFTVPYALVFYGEQFISSALTAILFSGGPVFTLLFDSLRVRHNLLSGERLLGLLLAFSGLLVIFVPRLTGPPSELVGGVAIVVAAAVSSLALVLAKHGAHGIDPLVGTTWQMGVGGPILLLIGLALERPALGGYSTLAVLALAYQVVFGSCVTFVTFYWLLKQMAAVQLSTLSFITPVVAVFVGWLVLGEALGLSTLAGAGVVLLGLALLHRPAPEALPAGD